MKLRHLTGALALTMAAAGAAQAQDTPVETPPATPAQAPAAAVGAASGFGMQGQMAITGDLQFELSHTSRSMNGGSSNTIAVQPTLDYFVAPNISVGATLAIAHSAAGGSGTGSITAIGVAGRAGYALSLTPILSFWPQLQLGYTHLDFSPGSLSGWTFNLGVFAPVLYHITEHLFFGIGPALQTDLISKVSGTSASKETVFGLTSVVGGYWGP